MDDCSQPTAERTTTTRTSHACERCRSLKTRCLPSERPGTCQRCFTAKRECAWSETPRKPRKARGPSRISQVEQKIDGLVASLVNADAPRATPVPAAPPQTPQSNGRPISQTRTDREGMWPGSWLPFPSSFAPDDSAQQAPEPPHRDNEHNGRFLEQLREIHSFGEHNDDNSLSSKALAAKHCAEPAIDDETVRKLLSSGQADTLLRQYRSMSASFPFVPLSPDASARDLHDGKPMLFLAMITMASWRDHQQQLALDKLYRSELANRTILRPRKTLSLVQSILVYLSCHKTQQIYFMLQLAIGLTLDLGLYQRFKRPLIEFPGARRHEPPSPEEQRERQRTYLGCYFLSSMVTGGLQKPNVLKYTDYMGECVQNLIREQEYSSDGVIGDLIALRRIDDQIHDAFYSEDTVDLPFTDSRISMNLRFMQSQLNEFKRNSHSEEFERALDLSSSYTEMQLHSISLRSLPPSNQQASVDATHLNALLVTLEAGKRFLDALLAFPVSEYHLISFSEWMRLPCVVITLARLCIPSEAHTTRQWDVKGAQNRVRLDLYLESLCYRMSSLTTCDKMKKSHPDFYFAMGMIMDLTKAWYVRRVRTRDPESTQTTTGSFPTPEAGVSATTSTDTPVEFPHARLGAMDLDIDLNHGDHDPFAFMKDMNFDMDKFFDMGLWDDEAYLGMGFGGGRGL